MNTTGGGTKVKRFTDLITWREGHNLAIEVYKTTRKFPKEELYSLVDQMRRCCVSITSNIAEGFSRQSKKEKQQFFFTAKGSLTELQNQLLLAKDIGYIPKEDFKKLADQSVTVHKLLNGLLKTAAAKH